MTEYEPIKSPCVGICTLDSDKICIGCFRSSEEITYWRLYTLEEREQALQRIDKRAEAMTSVRQGK